MKTLTKLALALVLLVTAANAPAQMVRGYVRSNGTYVAPHYRSDYGSTGSRTTSSCVSRNPYAASPSVSVRSYQRYDGTTVDSHVRTRANDTLTDNLNYRGYGTIRVPRYSSGW